MFASSSFRPSIIWLWGLLAEAAWLSRGREAKQASDSCSEIFSTVPSILIWRSSAPHQKQIAAFLFSERLLPLRLR